MKMNNTMKHFVPIGILSLMLLTTTSCDKEKLNSPSKISSTGETRDADISCPEETVHYTDLATTWPISSANTGQLNIVYQQCYAKPYCREFTNQTGDLLISCERMGNGEILNVVDINAVTFHDQVDMINYFYALAEDDIMPCASGGNQVITSLKFRRDAGVPTVMCAWVSYACCNNEVGEPE